MLNRAGGTLKQLDSTEILALITERLKRANHEVTGRVLGPSEIGNALDESLAGAADAILIGGGDGTVSGAAGRMVGSDKALGVLPLGTMNLFARGLGTPVSLHHAVDALARGTVGPVNVGYVNGRAFLHHVSFGVHPTMLRWRSLFERGNRFSRWTASGIAWVMTLRYFPLMDVRIDRNGAGDGNETNWRTPLLVVTPTPFSDESVVVPVRGESAKDMLAVYQMTRRTRFGLARAVLAAVTAGWNESSSFERIDVRRVTLSHHRKPTVRASIDGELAQLATPIDCICRPAALKVLRPLTPERWAKEMAASSARAAG